MNQILAVCGATASGKSALAHHLAVDFRAELLACDSMQIYRGMNIGTAKDDPTSLQVPLHLTDIADPKQEFSVSDYASAANTTIADLHAKQTLPILVGGTGLYLEAILYELQLGSRPNEAIRAQLQQRLQQEGARALHAELQKIDPQEAQRVHCNNTRRVIRALEMYYSEGIVKSAHADKSRPMRYNAYVMAIDMPRDMLYARIDARVAQMFAQGLAEEVQKLLNQGVGWECQSMQAIGYKEFRAFYEQGALLEQVQEEICRNTRHYAKRQLSWLRRYPFVQWIPYDQDYNVTKSNIERFLEKQ